MMLSPVKLELCSCGADYSPFRNFSPNSALLLSFWTGVYSSDWLFDPAWPRAVVLDALLRLGGPPSAGSGYWWPAVQGCPRSAVLGWPAAVFPIPGAGQAGLLAVAAEAGSLPSLVGWVGLLAVLAGSAGFRWVRLGESWSAAAWAVSAGAPVVWPANAELYAARF
jgi:hypothetical protein